MNVGMIVSALIQGIAFFVLAPLGVVVLTLGILGRRALTRARCSACRTALDRERLVARDRCPGCNAELGDAAAIRAVRVGTGWRQVIGGAAIFLLAVAGVIGGMTIQRRSMATAAATFGTNAPTPVLIRAACAQNSTYTFEAEELSRRLDLKTASAAEIRAELAKIITGGGGLAVGADRIFALSMSDGVVDPAIATALLTSSTLAPNLDPNDLLGRPPSATVRRPQRQRAQDEPVDVAYIVREVRADGTPIPGFTPFGVSPWQPRPIALPDGATRVEVDVELVLLSDFDAQRIAEPSGAMRPPSTWPASLATARVTIPATVPTP